MVCDFAIGIHNCLNCLQWFQPTVSFWGLILPFFVYLASDINLVFLELILFRFMGVDFSIIYLLFGHPL